MKTVTITYGRIPGYRDSRRLVWGFYIDDAGATEANYNHYSCPRRSAKRIYETVLRPAAEARGYQVKLVVDSASCDLTAGLEPQK